MTGRSGNVLGYNALRQLIMWLDSERGKVLTWLGAAKAARGQTTPMLRG